MLFCISKEIFRFCIIFIEGRALYSGEYGKTTELIREYCSKYWYECAFYFFVECKVFEFLLFFFKDK